MTTEAISVANAHDGIVEELIAALNDERQQSATLTREVAALQTSLLTTTEEASRCVAGVDATMRQTKEDVELLERDNALMREQVSDRAVRAQTVSVISSCSKWLKV
jgi:hypothetical protein